MSRYDTISSDVDEFFRSKDRNKIILSGSAAIAIAERAAEYGLRILGIEGGTWWNPGFEARLDSLWSSRQGTLDQVEVAEDNRRAADFIKGELLRKSDRPAPDVFILTTRPILANT